MTIQTLGVREFRDDLADAISRAKYTGQRIRISRHGVVAAALVPPEDLERLQRLEADTSAAAAARPARRGPR